MIIKLEHYDVIPMDLLLLADPSPDMIKNYIDRSTCFALIIENKIIGVCVVIETLPFTMEIINISVQREEQGKSFGKGLIKHVTKYAKSKGFRTLEVGTGNSSISQIVFYQKCGFSITGIDQDYFIENYTEPIFENGIQCRDMIRFSKKL